MPANVALAFFAPSHFRVTALSGKWRVVSPGPPGIAPSTVHL